MLTPPILHVIRPLVLAAQNGGSWLPFIVLVTVIYGSLVVGSEVMRWAERRPCRRCGRAGFHNH